jgi:hypothetical protein
MIVNGQPDLIKDGADRRKIRLYNSYAKKWAFHKNKTPFSNLLDSGFEFR